MIPEKLQALKAAAKQASTFAYAPYSNFPVGAALSLAGSNHSGPDIAGCNVENVSFSMTLCAEKNALGQAIARGIAPGVLTTMAIYMPGDNLYSPCGGCRQVIAELMAKDARIFAFCDSEAYREWSPQDLLPNGFDF